MHLKPRFCFLILFTLLIFFNAFAKEENVEQKEQGDSSNAANLKKKPLYAYWLMNLFFTRGILLRTELWDNEGNGAFRSRWRLFYSNPIGNRYSLIVEVPVALVVPSEGKSVAGLGDISARFQGEIGEHNLVRQIPGLRVFFPTGSHPQTGGNLMILNPSYQAEVTVAKYTAPSLLIDYYHSIIELNHAADFRVLALEPIVAIKQLGPEKVGISARMQLEWDFDFTKGRNGGILYISLAKQWNPNSVISFEFSPALTSYTREVFWDKRYQVNILTTF